MKAALILLLITTAVTASPLFSFGGFGAQYGFGGIGAFGAGGVIPNSQFYQALLERDLQKLLATPDLPDDLAQRAVDAVALAETSFENCNSTAFPFPYQQRICIIQAYAAARNALSTITQEAESRAQSATASPATQPVVVKI